MNQKPDENQQNKRGEQVAYVDQRDQGSTSGPERATADPLKAGQSLPARAATGVLTCAKAAGESTRSVGRNPTRSEHGSSHQNGCDLCGAVL